MLLSELNLKALNVSAASVLPISVSASVEGKEVIFKITAFQSGFGKGKKTVVSGSVRRPDTGTIFEFVTLDIERLRSVIAKLLGLKSTSERKPRAVKEKTEVEKLRASLAVARRICPFNEFANSWLIIDAKVLRAHFKLARKEDRENERKALQARAVDPLLAKIEKLSPEERALLLASLQ